MRKFKRLSKTLFIATALTGAMATASLLPSQYALAQQQFPLASPERAAAAEAANLARPKLKSIAGMDEKAARKLNEVQELMNATPPQFDEAEKILKDQDLNRLNATEKAAFLQMLAAVSQNKGDMNAAMGYYKQILAMESISNVQRDQMTFVVGQIEFSNGNLDSALGYFNEWFKYQADPSITNIVMLANVHYAAGMEEGLPQAEANAHFRTSIEFLNWAIDKSKKEGKEDQENWYGVLRALHNNLGETNKVIEYAELLVSRWPKKAYWTQLSGLYGQKASEEGLSEAEVKKYEDKQFAAFEAAFRQGMLDSGRELETMAQLYLYHESPYQAGKTITKSLDENLSEKNQRNLELQATALMNGKDYAKSVAPLAAAAEMSKDGNLYMRLANIYLTLDSYQEAATSIDKALEKGGLTRPDQSRLLQGQAYLALEQFDKARASFREAAKDNRSAKIAAQLLQYTDSEEKRIKDIKEYLS
ncbi:MAG: hypothetical protein KDF58_07785 [Alphaproteobacteria bacterium]|nr:hypothetical protein [Alphaproteobacteria bacterium]HPF45680.1 hypothetical protein [Emcibacteraceae bacterium]